MHHEELEIVLQHLVWALISVKTRPVGGRGRGGGDLKSPLWLSFCNTSFVASILAGCQNFANTDRLVEVM